MRIKSFANLSLFVLGLLSLVLYRMAPQSYSYNYCLYLFIIFCTDVYIIYKTRCKYTLVNFETFFTIAFAFVNYVYPMVFYQIDPYFSLFALDFPEDYINKGTAVATIAYTFLSLGLCKNKVQRCFNFSGYYDIGVNKYFTLYTNILIIAIIIALIPIMSSGTSNEWGVASHIRSILDVFVYYTLFQKLFMYRNMPFGKVFSNNRLFFILVIAYALSASLIGNRGIVIRIGSIVVLLYSVLYKDIKKLYLVFLLIFGMVFMFLFGAIRDSGSLEGAVDNSASVLSVGRDLTINNRSLYVLVDYADKNGVTYGQNFLSHLLSPIPFAQSTLLAITGWKVRDISSGNLVTDDYFDNTVTNRDSFGLGTNLVGDVYLAFGIIGVVLLFYLMGVVISNIYKKAQQGSALSLLTYSILFITAIIWTREAYFKPLQLVLWCLALYYIIEKKAVRKI